MPCGGGYNDLSSKNNRLNQYNFVKNSKKGAILIEFAFAMPVLFSLIYYIQDLHYLKRMQAQMDFVAHQMVGIIQNISQQRDNKAITKVDLINAGKSAYLSVFPGNTIIPQKAYYYPFGYYVTYAIFFIKGVDNNKANVLWTMILAGDGDRNSACSYAGMWYNNPVIGYVDLNRLTTKFIQNSDPSQIHPRLEIKQGETKIIVECSVMYCTSRHFADNTPCSQKSFREAFGFLFISPRYQKKDRQWYSFFNSVVIFTPKPGLFSETEPK